MSEPRYVLLLGSARSDGRERLQQAIDHLQALGEIEAASQVIVGPSVSPGDPHHYANQAVRLRADVQRDALAPRLKHIETALGRHDGGDGCAIDIDLAREYDAHAALRWENPAKLAHPLFVDLAAQVTPR